MYLKYYLYDMTIFSFPQVPCLLKRNNSRKMSYDITQSSYLEFGPNEAIFICSHYNQLDNEHLILFSFSSLIFHYLILAGHLPDKLFVFISLSQHLLRGESKIRLTSHFFFQSQANVNHFSTSHTHQSPDESTRFQRKCPQHPKLPEPCSTVKDLNIPILNRNFSIRRRGRVSDFCLQYSEDCHTLPQ